MTGKAPKKISRAQWEQIIKRVHRANYKFDPDWKCLIDGNKFKSDFCPHGVGDNEDIIRLIQTKESLAEMPN